MHSAFIHLKLNMEQSFGPEVALGINRYAMDASRRWVLTVPDWGEPMAEARRRVGVVVRCRSRGEEERWLETGLPVVNVSGILRRSRLPRVQSDDRRCGELAAEHLLDRGFTRFAAAFPPGQVWRNRVAGFARVVRRAGHRCVLHSLGGVPVTDHRKLIDSLATWLTRLPPATGILAASDILGRRLSDACRVTGLDVPQRIAIVGIDNSELMCHLADPPLTSVDINAEQIGFEAARVLDQLMQTRGRSRRLETVRVAPRGVIARASSDTLAIDDRVVAEALRVIRDQACDGLTVEALLGQVRVSRRSLENRMKRAVGRTPGQEIRRVRMAQACELLTHSSTSLSGIARRVGYADLAAFSTAFKAQTRVNPTDYRRRHRRPGTAGL